MPNIGSKRFYKLRGSECKCKKEKKMKTILIIAGLLVFMILFSRRNRKKVSNPIDTIKFGSCMGFKIGDSKQFVLSRINHSFSSKYVVLQSLASSSLAKRNLD